MLLLLLLFLPNFLLCILNKGFQGIQIGLITTLNPLNPVALLESGTQQMGNRLMILILFIHIIHPGVIVLVIDLINHDSRIRAIV